MVKAFARIPVFVREVRAEMLKVSWPTRKELIGATWVVIGATFLLTAYIGVLDFLLSKGVTSVLK